MEHDFSGLHKADLLQSVVEDFKLLDGQVSVHFYDYFPHSYAGGRAADRGNHWFSQLTQPTQNHMSLL